MVRVLNIISSLKIGGGVQQLLLNYYKHIDGKQIQFDFIVHGDKIGGLEKEVEKFGSNVYHVTPKKVSFIRNMMEINKIIKKGNYDVVHCHQDLSNFSSLFLAKFHSVPVRISHAHSNFTSNSKIRNIRNSIMRTLNKRFANSFFACSLDSGRWLHSKDWKPNGNNVLIKNAIDIERFSFNEQSRIQYRTQLGITEKTVLIHVGRFSKEKNHMFMLDILEEILMINKNYILLFVGSGDMEIEIRNAANIRKINEYVIFLGARNDVPELLHASDVLLLPSKHEGFGMTAIEAQVSGLPTLVSDRVPSDTRISELIKYLPLNTPSQWGDEIININMTKRQSQASAAKRDGYSISTQAYNFEKWIFNAVAKNRK